MSTTIERPVLGEVTVKQQDGARVVAWTLGTAAAEHGLTVTGMAAALSASADYLSKLSDAGKAIVAGSPGVPSVRVCQSEWTLPLIPNAAAAIEALMVAVVNSTGNIGRI